MSDPLSVTMIRNSTLLLEWRGRGFLTDPWFAMRMRFLPVFRRPGLHPAQLPPIEAVLASHLHADHFEAGAVRRLRPAPRRVFLPPGGLAALGRRAGASWRELEPWTSVTLEDVELSAVPGPHTLPGPEEVNYVLRLPGFGAVFFGGDAKLDRGVLAEVRRRFGPMRVALLPVGGSRIFGKRTVMGPADALAAADLLDAWRVVPIHEGGIWMPVPPASLHPGRARHLAAAARRRGEPERVCVLSEGQRARFDPA